MKIKFFGFLVSVILSATSFGQALNYQQAIGVPVAGTISGGPYMRIDNSGNTVFYDPTKSYNTAMSQDSNALNITPSFDGFGLQINDSSKTDYTRIYSAILGNSVISSSNSILIFPAADQPLIIRDSNNNGNVYIGGNTYGNGNLYVSPQGNGNVYVGQGTGSTGVVSVGSSGAAINGGDNGILVLDGTSITANANLTIPVNNLINVQGSLSSTYIFGSAAGGLTIQPTAPGLGINLVDNTYSYSNQFVESAAGLQINGMPTTFNVNMGSSLWSANSVLISDSSKNSQTIPLTNGQVLSANISNIPVAGNITGTGLIAVTPDGMGNINISSSAEPGETDTPVTCQFNAGSASGTTDVTATFNFKKVGSIVYVQIPEFSVTPPAASIFNSFLSAAPGCIPLGLRPENVTYQNITTNSNGQPPAGSPGNFEIDPAGNISIFYQNAPSASYPFPSGVPAGTGFGQIGTVNFVQQMMYSVSSGVPSYTITGSSTGGTITPPSQSWLPGDTTSVTFDIAPSPGYLFISATDNCNGGSPGGAPNIGNTKYIINTVTRNCTVSVVNAATYAMTTSTDGNGTISPPTDTWVVGVTTSLTFGVTPNAGYVINTVTDNCNGGSPGGSGTSSYAVTTVNQACIISATFSPTYAVSTTTDGNGTLAPSSATWTGGVTASIPFTVTPNAGYAINTVTDNCLSGGPSGSLSGSTYTLGNIGAVNQACTVNATFSLIPFTISTSNTGFGSGTFSPSSATWASTPIQFYPARAAGNQLNPYSMTDNCNGGSPGGTWDAYNIAYVVGTVTQNCTVSGAYLPYHTFAYIDMFATGSLATIPSGGYAAYNGLIFGFIDPTTATMATAQVTAIVNAVTQNANGSGIFSLGIGGEGYNYTTLNGIGFATVISNAKSQFSQVNAALSAAGQVPLNSYDLDLEGSDWPANGTAIDNLATSLAASGITIIATPQASTSGGDIGLVTGALVLTSGGTANNYGLALSLGHINIVNVQTYNYGAGLVCNGINEASSGFSSCISNVLNTLIKPTCSGPNPLCILGTNGLGGSGTVFNITQVVNARAGCYTIFNQPWCPSSPITSYNQSTILSAYATELSSALNNAYMGGITAWALNYDYGATLYTPPDNFAVSGAFTNTIIVPSLFKSLHIAPHYSMTYSNPALRGVKYDVLPISKPTREIKHHVKPHKMGHGKISSKHATRMAHSR